MFLRMDEIPYIHEDRPESSADNGKQGADPLRLLFKICMYKWFILKPMIFRLSEGIIALFELYL